MLKLERGVHRIPRAPRTCSFKKKSGIWLSHFAKISHGRRRRRQFQTSFLTKILDVRADRTDRKRMPSFEETDKVLYVKERTDKALYKSSIVIANHIKSCKHESPDAVMGCIQHLCQFCCSFCFCTILYNTYDSYAFALVNTEINLTTNNSFKAQKWL